MDSLMETFRQILEAAQRPAGLAAAIAFVIGGYYLIFGGDQGRQKAIKWFIGAAVGLIIVLGATALSTMVSDNVNF